VDKKLLNWLLFAALSFIWGSSFILIFIGLENGLKPFEIAALRIVSAGIVLLPACIMHFKKIPINKLGIVFLSGTLGSLLPAFLFCIAEQEIDSSLTGVLNSLTPIFVIIMGALFFKVKTSLVKIGGIIIAITGCIILLFGRVASSNTHHLLYTFYVVLATIMYGFNVNMVTKKLHNIPSIHIAAVSLCLNAVVALLVLVCTGYFSRDFSSIAIVKGSIAACVLGIGGTAVATVLFYMLAKRAGGVFASMVTYGIPFVAIAWGLYFKEQITLMQVLGLIVILFGVYIANKPTTPKN
jgi:drug/metabolite transporter (DMT)-like permease